jgi:CRP-like cAMP-binding protein
MLESLPFIPLFQSLTPGQIALLKPLFEEFTCPAETVIFEQGDLATHIYLIIKGEISIRYKPYDGPPITLTHLRAGDVCGWSAVVGSTYYTSGTISETEVHAIRIYGKHLANLVHEHPQTGEIIVNRLAQMVSSRWKNAYAQVHSLLDSE